MVGFVQGVGNASVGATSVAATVTGAVAGRTLQAFIVAEVTGRTLSISDDQGNTWTNDIEVVLNGRQHASFSAPVGTSADTVVTALVSGAAIARLTLMVHELSLIRATTPFDQQNSATATSAAPSAGAVTPTFADSIKLDLVAGNLGGNITWEGDYTAAVLYNSNLAMRGTTGYKVLSSTSAEEGSHSIGGSVTWTALTATYRGLAAAGGVVRQMMQYYGG